MFRHVVGFELRYQLRSPVFWGTAVIFFLLTLATVLSDDIRIGWGGQVFRNSPYAITMTSMVWCIFAIFIVTAFVSNVVLRDEETGFAPIIQTTQLSKSNYLFGRFTGGFFAASLAFLSVPLGALVATFAPGIDPYTLGPLRIWDYFYAYLFFCIPSLFVMGAALFTLATVTRSMLATYVGALIIIALYLFTSVYLSGADSGATASLVDPFGLSAFEYATRYWSAQERNTQLPPLLGLVLQNRVLWCAVALALLAGSWVSFTRKGFANRNGLPRLEARAKTNVAFSGEMSVVPPTRRALGWGPLATLTRFEFRAVLASPVFFILLGFAFINTMLGLWLAGDDIGIEIYPVTRVMIQTLLDQFVTIPLFVAAFYAGELVWRDRERRIHEIVDATPSPDWAFLMPKILAIAVLLLAMGLMSIFAAISVQMLKGYTSIEYGHYFTWYLAPWFVTMLLYAVLAVFVQTLVPHKFVGLLVVLLFFVMQTALPTMGFESHLYLYATTSPTPLSDMNGVGKYAGHAAWYKGYWTSFAVILTVLAWGLWQRGGSAPLLVRIRKLPRKLAGPAGAIAGLAAIVMASFGGYIYYNNYVLNNFPTFAESQRWAADYEKALLRYIDDPQPHITDVTLKVDLYPDAPKVVTHGKYVIENKTGAPLKQVYLTWPKAQVSKGFLGTEVEPELHMLSLDVPGARLTKDLKEFNFRIYTFDKAMAPGERLEIRFETMREQRGFLNAGNEDRVVANGTFIENFAITPRIGVAPPTLQDRAVRRKFGLDPVVTVNSLEDEAARAFNYARHDSDYVNADITLTGPADQTLIAPGQLVAHQAIDGRQSVRFRSDAPMLHFFSIQAGKYAVRREAWKGTSIEIYYHPSHTYNVGRFAGLAKNALDYYSDNFGPYQFKQFRIIEFPAYHNFAQAFPNTIPYSEAAGFIVKIDDTDGVDYIAYVTAHEMAHQWWFHQLIGADVEGSTVLSETLAQYSALMVMEKRYGPAMIQRFLKRSLDGYLEQRGKENIDEPTLERVQGQAYVRYQKGGNVMYLLKERMGEQAVNRALRGLLDKYALKGPPYPTSRDLIAALRAEARPEEQELITDLFQKITAYDLKVRDAKTTKRRDGKWDVTFTVEAEKRYADGKGVETKAPLNEIFDIGIFTAQPGEKGFKAGNVLSMTPQRLRTGKLRLTAVVAQQPKFVGVDPYLKYIDRNSSDNVLAVD
ncbi:MAG: aminopeptidase [Sphingomonadales bacterium]|nr:MAG: aminopeptidase [Sphingomonadales bacterium]